MTKKDWQLIASVIAKQARDGQNAIDVNQLCEDLVKEFKQQNERFDVDKFLIACDVRIYKMKIVDNVVC